MTHNVLQPVVSYAQNREDIIIDAFFKGMDRGTYVDIGANHPVADSVTKYFYLKGWSGVDIEPNEELAKLIKADRPRDHVITKGVSNKTEKAIFRIYKNTGLSTYSEEIKNESGNIYDIFKDEYKDVETQIDTLGNILDSIPGLGDIHFMKVDIEGMEYEALEANNWKKYRPELICIEANHSNKDWHQLLDDANYTKFFNDGLNDYYARKDSERLKNFAFPESVLMHYPKVVPFIPHESKLRVSDEFFNEKPDVPEKTSDAHQLAWAISSFDHIFRKVLTRRIIIYKRERLERAITQSVGGGYGGNVRAVSYATPKLIAIKGVLFAFSLTMKVAYKLKPVLKGIFKK